MNLKRFFMVLFICSIYLFLNQQISYANEVPSPKFVKVETIPSGDLWIYLKPGAGDLKFHIKTQFTNEVKLWLVPTGTQQWGNRVLIGQQRGEKNEWFFTWHYNSKMIIHHHVYIEIFGPGGREVSSLNVTRPFKGSSPHY